MLKYAGIGSRKTPDAILQVMILIAKDLGPRWLLRSGFAVGADSAFHYGAEFVRGAYEMYLPWPGYNNAPRNDPRFFTSASAEAYDVAEKLHPNWDKCGKGAKAMHARNIHQIAGPALDDKVDMVVCWTPEGKVTGGTGGALRAAEFLGIPIFNLALPTAIDELSDFVEKLENL